MGMKAMWMTTSLVIVGCTAVDSSERIDVDEDNAVGAVSIAIDQFETNGDNVYELRGLNAAGDEVALVRKRIGIIADLPSYLPGSDFGSEIILDAAGNQLRFVSHEVQFHHLNPVADPNIQGFVELAAVASALGRASIEVAAAPQAAGDEAYTYGACPAAQLNQTPVAKQCCGTTYLIYFTTHINPSNAPTNPGAAITRYQGPHTCTTQSGGACSGAACYWGPLGFARPSVETDHPYWRVETGVNVVNGIPFTFCTAVGYASPQTPIFGDVTGTFPNNQGCPGGNSSNGFWDY